MKLKPKKKSSKNSGRKKMTEYHLNPRFIKKDQFDFLQTSMESNGDLSGIVHNIKTGEIICGNQRSKVIDINECEIEIVKKFKKPDKTGTIAVGYIHWDGNLYNYREVVWDEETTIKNNIIANKAGGQWDTDILANNHELDFLKEMQFSEIELGLMSDAVIQKEFNEENTPPKYPIVPRHSEKHDCVIIVSDNEIDTTHIKALLDLKTKKSYKNETVGQANVLTAKEFIKLWKLK